MKITTKLSISTAAFLLPIAVILVFIISDAKNLIEKAESEAAGALCLKPIADLFEFIPSYTRAREALDEQALKERITTSWKEFEEKYRGLGGVPGAGSGTSASRRLALVEKHREDFLALSGESWEKRGGRAQDFIRDLLQLISHIGVVSGLKTDTSLEVYYFTEACLAVLPRIQERLIRIGGGLSRDGGVSEEFRRELGGLFVLLAQADHPQVPSALETAAEETKKIFEDHAGMAVSQVEFDERIRAYRVSMERLNGQLALFTREEGSEAAYSALFDALETTRSEIHKLWTASLIQLDTLLERRIREERIYLFRSLAFILTVSIPAFIIVLMTARSIGGSTARLKGVFKSLDRNDLSPALVVKSSDEFGEFMRAFNGFLEKLKSVFISFSQNAAMVSSSVYDLSSSAKEITTTANQQSASVAEIVSTMESSKNLSEQAAVKTAEVAELAVKTQELSRRGADLWDINHDLVLDLKDQNSKIIVEINNLADMLSRIDEAVAIIDTIADQTKLIAFNASLEASSSGEAGARFAVVAGEIRRFADNVVESTGEIKQKIEEVQAASRSLIAEADNASSQIDEGYARMAEQKTVFENIVEVSQNVAIRSQQISNLSKQQEFASTQIFTALKEISAGVKQFVNATVSTSKIADNLNVMSVELRETVDQYRTE